MRHPKYVWCIFFSFILFFTKNYMYSNYDTVSIRKVEIYSIPLYIHFSTAQTPDVILEKFKNYETKKKEFNRRDLYKIIVDDYYALQKLSKYLRLDSIDYLSEGTQDSRIVCLVYNKSNRVDTLTFVSGNHMFWNKKRYKLRQSLLTEIAEYLPCCHKYGVFEMLYYIVLREQSKKKSKEE